MGRRWFRLVYRIKGFRKLCWNCKGLYFGNMEVGLFELEYFFLIISILIVSITRTRI